MGRDTHDMNPAWPLHELGQSLWLDSNSRTMFRSGALERYVNELGVTGLTSNPTILAHAMAVSADYDASLARLLQEGTTDPGELVYSLALEDLGKAAWLFCPEWERSSRVDGYVSLEMSPHATYEAAGAFSADWAALLDAIGGKAEGMKASRPVT